MSWCHDSWLLWSSSSSPLSSKVESATLIFLKANLVNITYSVKFFTDSGHWSVTTAECKKSGQFSFSVWLSFSSYRITTILTITTFTTFLTNVKYFLFKSCALVTDTGVEAVSRYLREIMRTIILILIIFVLTMTAFEMTQWWWKLQRYCQRWFNWWWQCQLPMLLSGISMVWNLRF